MRVGLEAQNPNPEQSNYAYFEQEACLQLATAKQTQSHYTEGEAMAALHLVCYTQLSGGMAEWRPAFSVMCDMLTQTGLLDSENPVITLHTMTPTSQLLIKLTLVSSLVRGDLRTIVDRRSSGSISYPVSAVFDHQNISDCSSVSWTSEGAIGQPLGTMTASIHYGWNSLQAVPMKQYLPWQKSLTSLLGKPMNNAMEH